MAASMSAAAAVSQLTFSSACTASVSSRAESRPQSVAGSCRYSSRRGFLNGASDVLGSGSSEGIRGRQIAAPVIKRKAVRTQRFKVPSAVSDSGLGQADTDLNPDAGKVSLP